ncbi:MAG: UDP-N-acetylglucosamine pyrophosphorylase [Christensenellaceae bacterium]
MQTTLFSHELDYTRTRLGGYLTEIRSVRELFQGLKIGILLLGDTLGEEFLRPASGIWIHKNAKVDATARIEAPCIIDDKAEVRFGAYLRSGVVIGSGAIVGHASEVKNCVLFDEAYLPHFNYAGDSILGFKAHLGAGAILSNLKSDGSQVSMDGKETGLRKLGSIVGDYSEIGCNAVLCPGTVLGRNTTVYPLTVVRGTIEGNLILKSDNTIWKKRIY